MPIVRAFGTQTAVIGTEHILGADITAPFAVFQLLVNIAAMSSSPLDTLELRTYTQVASGDSITSSSALYQQIIGAPTGNGDQVIISLPVVSDLTIRFTLRQTTGTGRAYPWKVVSFP